MGSNGRLAENELFGKYRIVRLVGEGGMGAIYEAVHPVLKKRFAIKTLLPAAAAQRDARARFLREAEAASRINHPNVVAVIDVGTEGDTPYLVMELLEGETLDALLERRRVLPVSVAIDLMLPVISAVSTGHGLGVIHRDLKPQNIFLSRGPWGEAIPKVLDFGVSKLVDDREAIALTGTQAVLGTVTYMSPEQARGARGVDARSDQYAIGLILYEMVTGARAHPGQSALEVLHHIANGILVPPRTVRPELPAAMEAVLLRCLAAQPHDRYPSLRALGQALLPHAGDKARSALADGFSDLAAEPETAEATEAPAGTVLLPPNESPSGAGGQGGSNVTQSPRSNAGGTQILADTTNHGPHIDTTFREAATELSPPPDLKPVGASKMRAVAVSLVALGVAAGIAIVLANRSPAFSRQAPASGPEAPAAAAAPPGASPAAISVASAPSPVPTAAVAPAAAPADADSPTPSPTGGPPAAESGQLITFGARDTPPSQVTPKPLQSSPAAQRAAHPRRGGARGTISAGRTAGPTAVPDEPVARATVPVAPATGGDAPVAKPRRGANNALILK